MTNQKLQPKIYMEVVPTFKEDLQLAQEAMVFSVKNLEHLVALSKDQDVKAMTREKVKRLREAIMRTKSRIKRLP